MAWMRRRDNSGGQRDYLNAEDTAGRPMALASILFTLLFIAAIVLLLFSAGRWAYNQMIDEEVSVVTTTTQQESAKNKTSSGTVTVESGSVSTQTTETPSTATTSQSSAASESATTPTSTTATTTVTTAAAGVPNTGPGSLLSIFAVGALVATVVHYRYQLRKNR